MNGVNIKVKESLAVYEKIEKTAKRLKKKYNTKRKINEKLIRKQPLHKRIISGIITTISVVLFLLAFLLGFSIIAAKMQQTNPCFAGYNVLQIATGSMINSGHNRLDRIVAKSVDTHTLKPGDKIVFYDYPPSYKNFKFKDVQRIEPEDIGKTKSGLTIPLFLGLQTDEIKQAAEYAIRTNYHPIFHHIRAVYEDANGERWFTTYGSSNPDDDKWIIHEDYVIGIYDGSWFASGLITVIGFLSDPMMLVISIMAPFMLIAFFIVMACFREVQYAFLELDVVEEKRKLTDEICIECEIGFKMDEETKYKVLAQADENEKQEYIKLLWKDGEDKNSIKKYYLRKRLKLRPIEELCKLNRTCEEMMKNGASDYNIAKYYRQEKAKILKKEEDTKKRLKNLRKKYSKKQEVVA